MTKISKKNKTGFTIIELMIYVSIVSVAFVILTSFMVDVTLNAAQAKLKKEIQQNARLILSRITQDIRTAKAIQNVATDQITLTSMDSQTVIYCFANEAILYKKDSGPVSCDNATALTNDQVRVNSVTHFNLEPNSNLITIYLTLEQKNSTTRAEYSDKINLSSAVVPRALLY